MAKEEFNLVVMPGDGIGVDVTDAALAVLDSVSKRHGIKFSKQNVKAGAGYYKETGVAITEADMVLAEKADAILFGAMGLPDIRYPDGTEPAPQLDLRFRMELYAGLRPIRAIPGVPTALASPRARDIDFALVRESIEGLFASRGKGTVEDDKVARDTMVITRDVTERLSNYSFNLARRRAAGRRSRSKKGLVTLVDKSNAFRSFAFMRKVYFEVAAKHSDVEARQQSVDAVALDLVRRPWDYDVLVTENMFGDILSDLAAGLVGGMGFAPSGDIGDKNGLFQPCHGSAPDIAGKGIANPTAAILSVALMLDWLADRHKSEACARAAEAIEDAVDDAFGSGSVRSYDIGGTDGTASVTKAVIERICT